MQAPPARTGPTQRVDHNDLSALSARLLVIAEELAAMAPEVAKARAVREYDADRRKRALADRTREELAKGSSAAAAETIGRASVGYGEALEQLHAQLVTAETVISDYEAKRILWESVRSALSTLKTTSGNV